jgi:vitamin B12 transporter
MNTKLMLFSALFIALKSTCAFAQKQDSTKVNLLEDVVVSDTKFAQSKEKSGKVITVISQKELQQQSGQNIAQVLNTAVGVEINGSQSAAGKNLGYYVRGGKNPQVLILIDGIPVTDVSGINFEYDLRLLPVDQVESIEIMKGASSTLYGSGAATAVINIKLKKAGKQTIQGNAYVNIGSNTTSEKSKINGQEFNQGLSVNGNYKKATFFAGLNSTEISGMSQIAEPETTSNYEEDRFSRMNYVSKIGFKATEKLSLDFFGNYDRLKNAYDYSFDNTGLSDTDFNTTISEQFRFGFVPKLKYAKGEFILNSSFNKISREYDELNFYSSQREFALYESRSVNLDAFNKYKFSTSFFVVAGTNYQFHDMLSQTVYGNIEKENTKFNMVDPYFTAVYSSDFGLNINAGARLNIHSEYGNKAVYNVNPSYNFATSFPLKVLASYSTAFVTPSLYQLYSEYGNTSLTPEENTTIEAGFEAQLFSKKLLVNAVAFYREQNNSIGFYYDNITFEGFYINIAGENKAKGLETEVRVTISKKLSLRTNYTFTQVDAALDRLIPKHKVNAGIDFQPTRRTFFNVSYQYLDARQDIFYDATVFATMNTTLASYQLVNATAKYELIANRLTVFGAVTNILNEQFIENVGYSTRGRNFKIGLNIVL